uniref:Uncharacterized protein n=1 Tax=Arundo donax TaxID=35708 RepID=A0A0A9G4E9_ARUDO
MNRFHPNRGSISSLSNHHRPFITTRRVLVLAGPTPSSTSGRFQSAPHNPSPAMIWVAVAKPRFDSSGEGVESRSAACSFTFTHLAFGNGCEIGSEPLVRPTQLPLPGRRRRLMRNERLLLLLRRREDERRHGAPPPPPRPRAGDPGERGGCLDGERGDLLAPEPAAACLGGEHEVDPPRAELLGAAHGRHGALEPHPVGVAQEPPLLPRRAFLEHPRRRRGARVLPQLPRGQQHERRRPRRPRRLAHHRAAARHAEPHLC